MSLNGVPCVYCGLPMIWRDSHNQPRGATKDHIISRALGGAGRKTVYCCRQCNEEKMHLRVNEYRAMLSVRRGRLHIFYFERLAARVFWLIAATRIYSWAASIGF